MRRLVWRGLLVGASVALLGAPAAAQFEKAEELFADAKITPALDEYFRLVEEDPSDVKSLMRIGQIMLIANQPEKARSYLLSATDVDPVTGRAILTMIAESYRREGKFAEASPIYERLGNATLASLYASFQGQTPYELVGDARRTTLAMVEHDSAPLVSIQINDRDPILCAVDTGHGPLLLDTRYATGLGLETFGQLELLDDRGGKVFRTMSRIDSVTLGEFRLENVPIAIGSVSHVARRFPDRQVQGVIGASLLMHLRPTFDFAKGELILEKRGTWRRPAEREIVGRFMIAGDHQPVAFGQVNHRGPFFWSVETGLPDVSLSFGQFAMEKIASWDAAATSPDRQDQPRRDAAAPREFKLVSIAGLALRDVTTTPGAFPEPLAERYGFRIDGVVGPAFFEGHVVTFDFDRLELVMRKGEAKSE